MASASPASHTQYPPAPGTLLRIPGSTVVVTKSGDFFELRRGELTGRRIQDPPRRMFHSIAEWHYEVGAPYSVDIKVTTPANIQKQQHQQLLKYWTELSQSMPSITIYDVLGDAKTDLATPNHSVIQMYNTNPTTGEITAQPIWLGWLPCSCCEGENFVYATIDSKGSLVYGESSDLRINKDTVMIYTDTRTLPVKQYRLLHDAIAC